MKSLFVVTLLLFVAGHTIAQWNPNNQTTGNIYYNGGNVGIGTASPYSKLNIMDNGVSINASDQFNGGLIIQSNTGGRSQTIGAQLEFVIPANIDGSNLWGQGRIITVAGNSSSGSAAGKMILGTRRSWQKPGTPNFAWYYGDDITIDQSGLVGIGTTTPVSKLHVSGDNMITVGDFSSSNGVKGIHFTGWRDNTADYFGASIEAEPVWSCCTGYPNGGYAGVKNIALNFNIHNASDWSANAKTTAMRINYDGNVGIGTMSPDAKLEVFGKSSTGLRINGTNNDFEALSIYNTTSSNLPSGNGAIIQFYNNAVNNNNGVFGASIKSVSVNNFYGWESDLYLRTTRNNSYTTQTILDALVVKGGSGNVGIGTTNPNQKLTVNGTIYGKEVKVDLNVPGPDYVFEPSYKLPSLTEIENYIKANKHLPEVPSAKEMETNGINLSEMNMLLLKKIEELTLHQIEANKKIELLQNQVLELLQNQNKK